MANSFSAPTTPIACPQCGHLNPPTVVSAASPSFCERCSAPLAIGRSGSAEPEPSTPTSLPPTRLGSAPSTHAVIVPKAPKTPENRELLPPITSPDPRSATSYPVAASGASSAAAAPPSVNTPQSSSVEASGANSGANSGAKFLTAYCSNCGAPVSPQANFCGQCGTRLTVALSHSVTTPIPPDNIPPTSQPPIGVTPATTPIATPATTPATNSNPAAQPPINPQVNPQVQVNPQTNRPINAPINADPHLELSNSEFSDLVIEPTDLATNLPTNLGADLAADLATDFGGDLATDFGENLPEATNQPIISSQPIMTPPAVPQMPPIPDPATQVQPPPAGLQHLSSGRVVELPRSRALLRIGKPYEGIVPDIDVSGFAYSEIISRSHAVIRIEGDQYYIEDMGSSNGTYINHQPLIPGNRHRLQVGDRIALGKGDLVVFLFFLASR